MTYKISDKLRATVDRMYEGVDRERVIKQLEAGKTVCKGGAKLKADKVEKPETDKVEKPEKVATTAPAKTAALKDTDN